MDLKSDGCTLFPEGPWSPCCVQHDKDYTDKIISRSEADRKLRECIVKQGRPTLAIIIWLGVRLFGKFHW